MRWFKRLHPGTRSTSNPARKVSTRTSRQLGAEWDRLAPFRETLISNGDDLSYRHILVPSLQALAGKWLNDGSRVIDVGCGTGHFAHHLASEHPGTSIVGIDLSETSIRIARQKRAGLPNLSFLAQSVETFQRSNTERADVVVANMLFQNVTSLPSAIEACRHLLKGNGVLVVAIPHPCFWPRYWGYDDEPWFSYDEEVWIEAPFRTSLNSGDNFTTSHAYRPLELYLNAFRDGGFALDEASAPMPSTDIERSYPLKWKFPRFYLARYRPTPP